MEIYGVEKEEKKKGKNSPRTVCICREVCVCMCEREGERGGGESVSNVGLTVTKQARGH